MFKRAVPTFLSLFALVAASPAAPYKLTFSGVVTDENDDAGFFASNPNFALGSLLTATYLIDPGAPDEASGDPTYGQYTAQLLDVRLNNATFPSDLPIILTQILIENDSPFGVVGHDSAQIHTMGQNEEFGVDFYNETWLFDTDAIPDFTTLLPKSTWSPIGYLYSAPVNGTYHYSWVNGTISSVTVEAVPEPGTVATLGLGAAALLRRRRK